VKRGIVAGGPLPGAAAGRPPAADEHSNQLQAREVLYVDWEGGQGEHLFVYLLAGINRIPRSTRHPPPSAGLLRHCIFRKPNWVMFDLQYQGVDRPSRCPCCKRRDLLQHSVLGGRLRDRSSPPARPTHSSICPRRGLSDDGSCHQSLAPLLLPTHGITVPIQSDHATGLTVRPTIRSTFKELGAPASVSTNHMAPFSRLVRRAVAYGDGYSE
jgi:hypothetical protein